MGKHIPTLGDSLPASNGYMTDLSWATLVYFVMAIHFMELINLAD